MMMEAEVIIRERERFEDALLPALKLEEAATSKEMQMASRR